MKDNTETEVSSHQERDSYYGQLDYGRLIWKTARKEGSTNTVKSTE